MIRHVLLGTFALLAANTFATGQSYPPAPGMPGATAINSTSPLFGAWATGITVTRGYVNISNHTFTAAGSTHASAGVPGNALGPADGNSVSLGDGGTATLTFAAPISNGPGFDFAVFETGTPDYLELAFVEASSDGVNFFRFPCHSQTQATSQLGTFGSPAPQYLNNLAGKYGGIYGTPFDLSDLPSNPLLDKDRITHIRIVDVVGSLNPLFATYDSFGNAINDSFPTPFASGGFDLQGVGVIHQNALGSGGLASTGFAVYPNPATDYIYINGANWSCATLYDATGRPVVTQGNIGGALDIRKLPPGIYILQVKFHQVTQTLKVIKR